MDVYKVRFRRLLFSALVLILYIQTVASAKISDKRLCADRNCENVISRARSLANHKTLDPAFLKFDRGEVILVMSKSAGSRPDLWGGQLDGRKGYFPRSFVKEYKVEVPNPTVEVDTEEYLSFEQRLAKKREEVTSNNAPAEVQESADIKTEDKKSVDLPEATDDTEVDDTDVDDTDVDDTDVDETDVDDTDVTETSDNDAKEDEPDETEMDNETADMDESVETDDSDLGKPTEASVDDTVATDQQKEKDPPDDFEFSDNMDAWDETETSSDDEVETAKTGAAYRQDIDFMSAKDQKGSNTETEGGSIVIETGQEKPILTSDKSDSTEQVLPKTVSDEDMKKGPDTDEAIEAENTDLDVQDTDSDMDIDDEDEELKNFWQNVNEKEILTTENKLEENQQDTTDASEDLKWKSANDASEKVSVESNEGAHTDDNFVVEEEIKKDSDLTPPISIEDVSKQHLSSATPVREQVTATPVQEQTTTPVQEQVTTPAQEQETATPAQEQITTIKDQATTPVQEQVTATPVQEQVTATPVQEQVTATPVQEQVTATPVQEQVTATPVQEQATTPVQEQVTTPVQEQMTTIQAQATTPVQEQVTATPVEEQVTATPVQEQVTTIQEQVTTIQEQASTPVQEQVTATQVQEQVTTIQDQVTTPTQEQVTATKVQEQVTTIQEQVTTIRKQVTTPVNEQVTATPVQEQVTATPAQEQVTTIEEKVTATPVKEQVTATPVQDLHSTDQLTSTQVQEQLGDTEEDISVTSVQEEATATPIQEQTETTPVLEHQPSVTVKEPTLASQTPDELTQQIPTTSEHITEQPLVAKPADIKPTPSNVVIIVASQDISSEEVSSQVTPDLTDNIDNKVPQLSDHVVQVQESRAIEPVQSSSSMVPVAQSTTETPALESVAVTSPTTLVDEAIEIIDGTTFPAGYFNMETSDTSGQITTTAVAAEIQATAASETEPTNTADVPTSNIEVKEVKIDEVFSQPEPSTDIKPSLIRASATLKEVKPVDDKTLEILGSSFLSDSLAIEDTVTSMMDSVNVIMYSESQTENITVFSDSVRDEVQPSLDQDPYRTVDFLSRKPLSTGSDQGHSSFDISGASAESTPAPGTAAPEETQTEPITGHGQPITGQGQPLTGQGQPLTGQGQPLTGQDQPLTGQGQPLTGQGQPLTGQGQPLTAQGQPLTGQGQPLTAQGQPITGQGQPIAHQGKPLTGQDQPLTGHGQPLTGQDQPLTGQDQPLTGQAQPGKVNTDQFESQSAPDLPQDLYNIDKQPENVRADLLTSTPPPDTVVTPTGYEDDIPPPPTGEIPATGDPYSSDLHLSRRVPDEKLDDEPALSFLQSLEPKMKLFIDVLPPSLQSVLEQEPLGFPPTVTVLVTMASLFFMVTVSCCSCLCGGSKKSKKEDPLVIIRGLEEQLFITTKEKENMEDDIQLKDQRIQDLQGDLQTQGVTTGALDTYKLHNDALKKQVTASQQEGQDLQNEVAEKLQEVKANNAQISALEKSLHTEEKKYEKLEQKLQVAQKSVTEKTDELHGANTQIQGLTDQVQFLETRKQQLDQEAEDWAERLKEATEQVDRYTTDSKRTQEEMAFKENELEVLRDCFLQVKAFQNDDEMEEDSEGATNISDKLNQMMDVSRVNATLKAVEEERNILQNKYDIEEDSRKDLEDQVELLKRKAETMQTDKMKAERQCQEAQTKLNVLTTYFKEKEAELARQLGEQQVLKNQNMSKLETSDSMTKVMEQEVGTYRAQVDDLKSEITKAERDFRSQIAANEKKAHENWLQSRAAERELKESKLECSMLRQKLTDLERRLMQGPPGLIRPITTRGIPPPGMINGPLPPPPPGMDRGGDRPGSRGSVHGNMTPRLRDDDYRDSPGPDRIPPPPDRRLPPGPRPPMLPHGIPLNGRTPPPYSMRGPHPMDRRSPPQFGRFPHPRGPRPPYPPPMRGPPPPHLHSPPLGPPDELDNRMDQDISPYSRQHPPPQGQGSRDRTPRQQSQV